MKDAEEHDGTHAYINRENAGEKDGENVKAWGRLREILEFTCERRTWVKSSFFLLLLAAKILAATFSIP